MSHSGSRLSHAEGRDGERAALGSVAAGSNSAGKEKQKTEYMIFSKKKDFSLI